MSLISKIVMLSEDLFSLFFPALCQECKVLLPANRHYICKKCYKSISALDTSFIKKLKNEINKPFFEEIIIPFEFSDILQKLIHTLKYQQGRTLAYYFAESIAELLDKEFLIELLGELVDQMISYKI